MSEFIEIPANKKSLALRKPVFGIGVNDAPYMVYATDQNGNKTICPYYKAWKDMLRRCYCPKYHSTYPTYIDCTVHYNWLSFVNFKAWMINKNWKGMHLDKDIKVIGNKIYSELACLFITSQVNTLLNYNVCRKGEYPTGVYFHKVAGKFRAECSKYGSKVKLGLFETPEEASAVYRDFKKKVIIEAANLEENLSIRPYLLKHAELLNK